MLNWFKPRVGSNNTVASQLRLGRGFPPTLSVSLHLPKPTYYFKECYK